MYSENQGADHSPYPDDERDTEYSQGLDEAPGAYIEKITDINESLKEELEAVIGQMEMQLHRIQEKKRQKAAHEQYLFEQLQMKNSKI